MKTHTADGSAKLTAEMIQAMSGPELDALAARGMGSECRIRQSANGGVWCEIKKHGAWIVWHPSSKEAGWRDAGGLLDEIHHGRVGHLADGHYFAEMAIDHASSVGASADTGPLAITRAFIIARLDRINEAIEEEK